MTIKSLQGRRGKCPGRKCPNVQVSVMAKVNPSAYMSDVQMSFFYFCLRSHIDNCYFMTCRRLARNDLRRKKDEIIVYGICLFVKAVGVRVYQCELVYWLRRSVL